MSVCVYRGRKRGERVRIRGKGCTLTLSFAAAAPDKCNGKTPGFLLHVKCFISMQPVATVCNCTYTAHVITDKKR